MDRNIKGRILPFLLMNNMIRGVDDVAITTQRKKCDNRPIDSTKRAEIDSDGEKIRIDWGGV